MIALVPATPIAVADDPVPAQHSSVGERPADDPTGPVRDTRPARLEVELRYALGSAAPVAAPFRDIDVWVELPDGEPVASRARTDERGVATFSVPRGDRCLAQISSGPAAATSVELRAGEIVRATLVLEARVIVNGTVVDEAGAPVAAADIVLLPWIEPNGQTPRPRRVARSGGDGRFTIGLGTGGRLGALHDRFAPSPMFAIPPALDPTKPPEEHTLRLVLPANAATLAVRVTDARGKAVAHAEVEIRGAGAAPAGTALIATPQRHFTDDDGRTSFGVRPGKLEYVARKKGHATARGGGELLPATTSTLEIKLQTSCGVHGYVQTADGVRVPNARVWSGTSDVNDFVLSDPEGAFRLDDLPPGQHELRARQSSPVATRADALRARTRLELAPGQIANWVAVLEPPTGDGLVRGEVVDTEGRPLANCRVHLRCGARLTKTVADEHGVFRGERPALGPLDALVYSPETPLGAFATAVFLGVDPDAEALRLVVDRTARTTTMSGRVVSIEQAPLAATIVCYHHERRETARFQAQADGVILVPRVPPGTIDVHIEHPTKAPFVKRDWRADADVPLDLGLVVLGAAATLHGKLTGPGGTVPESAVVALQTKDQRLLAEYAAGVYRFDSVPPGQHVLQVQGTGVAPWNYVIRLEAGVDLEQNIELRIGVPRRIVVRLPGTGEGMVSLAIRVPGKAHTWFGSTPLRLDEATPPRSFAEFVAWMAPGTYEAIAWCGEVFEARDSVLFVDGDDGPITLRLQPR